MTSHSSECLLRIATTGWKHPVVGLALAVLIAAGCGGSESGAGNTSDGGISDNGGNNGGGLDGGHPLDGGGGYPDGGCQPMSLQAATSVDGYNSDVFNWYDSDCRPRSAALVRNSGIDPGGSHGGYMRSLSFQVDGRTRRAVGQPGTPWHGWGYVVSHYGLGGGDDTSHDHDGTYRTVLNGTHHSL